MSQAQLTLVLVTVSAASAVAMSLYPALAHMLHLTDRQAGFLMGASIHDVAQSLGAGYSYSQEAGQTATVVKLTRVALLAPALALVALAYPKDGEKRGARIGVPWFVLGFLALTALHSFVALPNEVLIGGPESGDRAVADRGDLHGHSLPAQSAVGTGLAIVAAGGGSDNRLVRSFARGGLVTCLELE